MKLLKVINNKGYFIKKNKKTNNFEDVSINLIGKSDIIDLLNLIIELEDIEKCDLNLESQIENNADKIIYVTLGRELNNVIGERTNIIYEIDSRYKNATAVYSIKTDDLK